MHPSKLRRVNRRSKGFMLLEVMIALAVIGLGLLGVMLTNVNVQKMSELGYERVVATQDAHRVLELVRNASATGNFPSNVTQAFPNGGRIAGFSNLIGEQVVVTYANPTTDPLDIMVTASWLEGGRRNTSIQLRTLMTQRG